MKVHLIKSFNFEAAHHHPGEGQPIHGHHFEVHIFQSGDIDPSLGWLVDFGEIKAAVKPVLDQLDHRFLNDIPGLGQGTREELEAWIHERIRQRLPFAAGVRVRTREQRGFDLVRLPEDPLLDLPERYAFRFEAAHSLPLTPPDHKCHRLHGHSYRIELAMRKAPPPRKVCEEIYRLLDFNCLNQIEGLHNPTAENLAVWMWDRLTLNRVDPKVVIVAETCESSCVFSGR